MLPSTVVFYFINCLVIGFTCQVAKAQLPVQNDGADGDETKVSSDVDIKELVDYVYVQEGFDKIVENSYVPSEQHYSSVLGMSLFNIEVWINQQPEVLLSYLRNLNVTVQRVAQKGNFVASLIKKYPQLQQEMNEIVENSKKHFIAYEAYHRICVLNNCSEPLEPRPKRSVSSDLFRNVSLIEEIRTKLNKSVQIISKLASASVLEIYNRFSKRIDVVRQKLLPAVEKYFGHEMYNIMKLQQDFQNYENQLHVYAFEVSVDDINENLNVLRGRITPLGRLLKRYDYYCHHCNGTSPQDDSSFSRRSFNMGNHVVDYYVARKSAIILSSVYQDVWRTFYPINSRIRALENLDSYLKRLEPARQRIANMTQEDRQSLLNLQQIAPPSAESQFVTLLNDVKQYLQRVNALIHKISPVPN